MWSCGFILHSKTTRQIFTNISDVMFLDIRGRWGQYFEHGRRVALTRFSLLTLYTEENPTETYFKNLKLIVAILNKQRYLTMKL